jgi:formylmethanofuran dehydrogenase subunit E
LDSLSIAEKYPEANSLFEKIVVRREEATEEEQNRLMQLFTEMSFEHVDVPEDEMFMVEHKTIKLPAYAPIFSSTKCAFCGEKVMETRITEKDGKPACISCSGDGYYEMNGAGIEYVGGRSKGGDVKR